MHPCRLQSTDSCNMPMHAGTLLEQLEGRRGVATATVECASFVELLTLTRESLERVLAEHNHDAKAVLHISAAVRNHTAKNDRRYTIQSGAPSAAPAAEPPRADLPPPRWQQAASTGSSFLRRISLRPFPSREVHPAPAAAAARASAPAPAAAASPALSRADSQAAAGDASVSFAAEPPAGGAAPSNAPAAAPLGTKRRVSCLKMPSECGGSSSNEGSMKRKVTLPGADPPSNARTAGVAGAGDDGGGRAASPRRGDAANKYVVGDGASAANQTT